MLELTEKMLIWAFLVKKKVEKSLFKHQILCSNILSFLNSVISFPHNVFQVINSVVRNVKILLFGGHIVNEVKREISNTVTEFKYSLTQMMENFVKQFTLRGKD